MKTPLSKEKNVVKRGNLYAKGSLINDYYYGTIFWYVERNQAYSCLHERFYGPDFQNAQ